MMPPRARDWTAPLLAAALLTALGATKPIVVDEAIYAQYASHIALQPGDPYGFEAFWYEHPEPAHHLLVPLFLPYWVAAARAALGDSPLHWKLSLFPFALALTASLSLLLRRIAPSFERPLLWMVALSPGVLTSFGLMLEIPALALSLLGVAAFITACERGRIDLALLAGVIAGLAMQTKYSGVLGLAAVALYALIFRRPAFGVAAAAAAIAVFAGWETFLAARYGESHFLYAVGKIGDYSSGGSALQWGIGLASLVGATLPAVGVLTCAALRPGRASAVGAALAVAGIFAALPLLPAGTLAGAGRSLPNLSAPRPELLVFAPLGLVVLAGIASLARALLGRIPGPHGGGTEGGAESRRWDHWLLGWLAVELVGFFVLSPYLAARRVVGLGVVATLLAGRVAYRYAPTARAAVTAAMCSSAAIGALFLVADHCDALARRRSVVELAERVAALPADAGCETLWFTGHWSFLHYGEELSMRPAFAGASRLKRGDCLAIPHGVQRQRLAADPRFTREIPGLSTRSRWPWSTIPSFYVGPVPVRAQPVTQVRIALYRVLADHVPAAQPPGN
ncbi:MAG: hypothetical protein ACE5FL_05500 [Myxococcota bacterium]